MSDIIDPRAGQFPIILREMLEREYGKEAPTECVPHPVTLRANTLKTTRERVAEALLKCGIGFEQPRWYPDAFVLKNASERDVRALPLYERGEIYLQSLSSMLPPLVLGAKAKEQVLDMAAAPGGKTTQICALSGGGALVTACEKDKIRFGRLKFNLARQGAAKVNAMMADAAKLDEFFRFDKILLDAPCTGSGTSDAGKFSLKLLSGCVKAQRALLEKGLKLLKPGGTLVYSTCSILKEENEEIIDGALRSVGGELVPIGPPLSEELPLLGSEKGTLTVRPCERFEGFFVAKIVK